MGREMEGEAGERWDMGEWIDGEEWLEEMSLGLGG